MEHFITEVRINEVRHLKNITIKLNPEKRQHLILKTVLARLLYYRQ